jgi:hypothetical protein
MRRILTAIIILPALVGLVASSLIFLRVWDKRKSNPAAKSVAVVGPSLPRGSHDQS